MNGIQEVGGSIPLNSTSFFCSSCCLIHFHRFLLKFMPRICKNSDLFRLYYEMMNLKQYVNEILNIHRDERVFDFEFDGQKFG